MTPRERRAAVGIFVLLLPALAAFGWSARLAGQVERLGPLRSFGSGGAEHAAVFFAQALHVFDGQGQRLARQPLAELGLGEEPNDMDWTTSPEGVVQAWFFEDTPPRIVRCRWDTAAARLVGCATALAGPQLKANPVSMAVHLAADPARGRVFVADAQGHAVQAFALASGALLARSAPGELYFPNRLRIEGDLLGVADNDHHRIVWLDIAGATPGFAPKRALPLPAHPDSRGVRKAADFVSWAAQGDQPAGLAALAVRQGQKLGRILLYAGGEPRGMARIAHTDPLVIDRLGNALVAADFLGVALFRVDRAGRDLGPFGEPAFQQELEAARGAERGQRLWRRIGWAALVLGLAAGFVLAWRFGERRRGVD